MKRIFLLGDSRKGHAKQLIQEIQPWIERRAKVVGTDFTGKAKLDKVQADFLLVFGGDGSILSAARRMGKNQIPTLGVNLGRLGFLASLSPENLARSLGQVLDGHFSVEERLMLRCQLRRKAKVVFDTLALNDAHLARESHGKMITVEVAVADRQVIDYRCDGIVIATPTGATGYSLSAGGPILDSRLAAFVVTPICPHTLTNRPLVVPSQHSLHLRVTDLAGKGIFTADGQEWRHIAKDEWIEIRAAREKFKLVSVPGSEFYSRLRTVLGWKGKLGN